MHTVATYFHPSRISGKWSEPARLLCLNQLGVQYAKRRGRELHGEAEYDKAHYLKPPAEDNNFVSVVLPIALQALFSKSHAMVGGGGGLVEAHRLLPSVAGPARPDRLTSTRRWTTCHRRTAC